MTLTVSLGVIYSLFEILRFAFDVPRKLLKLCRLRIYFLIVSPACRASSLARCLMISPSIK